MNPILPSLLALALLSGCIGYPPDAARPGDTVQVRYVAHDLAGDGLAGGAGGAPVANGTASVVVGGAGGLGAAVARALVGHRAGDVVRVESRGDAGLAFTGVVGLPHEFGRRAATEQVQARVFREVIGEPQVGLQFDYPGSIYVGEVLSFDNATVSLALRLPPDPRNPHPEYGIVEVFRIEGDEIVDYLEPMEDRPAFAGPLGTLLPEPGTYRVRGVEAGNLTLDYSFAPDPRLVGRNVRFEVTVLDVQHGAPGAAVPGEYGHRLSPQLGARPLGNADHATG